MMTDQELVAQLRAQTDTALVALINAYGVLIRQVALRYLSDEYGRGYLSDVENRVYYKVWTRIATYDPTKGTLAAWLAAVAKHQALDYQRGLAADLRVLDIDTVDVVAPSVGEPLEWAVLFAPLTSIERQVFELFFVQGLDASGVAQRLHMRRSAVYQHLSRGRKKLRQGGGINGDPQ
ncbi:RNA polymerase sigma factor [Lacticaseibacillus absianus]|uniref:RNA polymerase sigma factor n=1 Tax=Lacticaseibacillus absianus TaxID=2729623 RepID=UPI001FE9E47A|nr:sigma factor-like helix-turn-helix DNA-binding protein [Lacticaseibacillus absianus]